MQGHRDLKVYQKSFAAAMQIFHLTKSFPPEEKYSLTDQIRRSSRSVAANIGEGYRKRQYENMFASKMADADAECAETQVWLEFSKECGYLDFRSFERLNDMYDEIGRMLGSMIRNPERFKPLAGKRN